MFLKLTELLFIKYLKKKIIRIINVKTYEYQKSKLMFNLFVFSNYVYNISLVDMN